MAQQRKIGNSDKSMTAVDYLISELKTYVLKKNDIRLIRPCLDKAKQMEKDLAFQSFKAGQDSMEEGGKNFEQYYGEYNGSSVAKNRD